MTSSQFLLWVMVIYLLWHIKLKGNLYVHKGFLICQKNNIMTTPAYDDIKSAKETIKLNSV